MKLIKTIFLLIFSISMGLTNILCAEEIKMGLIFSPKDGRDCKAITNKFIYEKRGDYEFQLLFDKPSLPKEMLKPEMEDYFEVSVSSVVADHPESLEMIKIPFKDLIPKFDRRNFNMLPSLIRYSFFLNPPKSSRSELGDDFPDSKYKSWMVQAELIDKRNGKVLASQGHSLNLIKKGISLYTKIEGSETYFFMEGSPEEQLFDNFDGTEPLTINFSSSKSKVWEKSKDVNGVASVSNLSLTRNPNFTAYNPFSMPSSFFRTINPTTGAFTNFTGNTGSASKIPKIALVASSQFTSDVVAYQGQGLHLTFSLLPGESGMIFSQTQVESARYKKLGGNSCGFLEEKKVETLKKYYVQFYLVLVDRTRVGDSEYLRNLALEKLPKINNSNRLE